MLCKDFRFFLTFLKPLNIISKNCSFGLSCHQQFSKMSTIKIGTHNGTFHCDEVLACYMLKLLPEYKDAEIVR